MTSSSLIIFNSAASNIISLLRELLPLKRCTRDLDLGTLSREEGVLNEAISKGGKA
jgi:hypothetical protein